jgi:alpha-tubulin suppressor-like RCC1 family protein
MRRLGWAALLGALPALLGACGLLIGLEDHQATPGADAGADATETPDATDDAPPDVVGPDGCAGAACSGACVDTSSDPANCGACGAACLAGFTCTAGVCGDHIEQISAGSNHGCALLHDGSIWCWGNNGSGQLGKLPSQSPTCLNTYPCESTPIQVHGLPTKMIQVSAGADATCALESNGTVWCWGANASFQLGRASAPTSPTPDYDPIPLSVPGLPAVEVLSVGAGYACVVSTGGSSAYCWGSNLTGTLGNGQQEGSPGGQSPNEVAGLPKGLVDISTGLGGHACVLDSAQQVHCWGSNQEGQLGHPSATDNGSCAMTKCTSTPTLVAGLTVTGGWIRCGKTDSCAEIEPGKVACWGSNVYGQLALTPDAIEHPMPTVVLQGTPLIAGSFSGSNATSCVIDKNLVQCWGDDTYGELGRGFIVSAGCSGGGRCDPLPGMVKSIGGGVPRKLATGAFWAMVLTGDNQIYAWGANFDARLGHDPLTSNDLATCGYQNNLACNPAPQRVRQPGAPPP